MYVFMIVISSAKNFEKSGIKFTKLYENLKFKLAQFIFNRLGWTTKSVPEKDWIFSLFF